MANEYEKATSTARGRGRRRALAEEDQYQQMLQKLVFGTTGPVILPGQRGPIFATKGEQSRYDNRYSIGRVTPSEAYQRFLDSGFGKEEALPAETRTGVGVPAGVPEGTGIRPDGKLLAFADWKAAQPKSAQGWGQAQQMVLNPMTRSYRPSQFSGEGLQQGLSYKAGYNLAAGNPSENASRYAAALVAMGGSIPSERRTANAAKRNAPSRTFEERRLDKITNQAAAIERGQRMAMQEFAPTREQLGAEETARRIADADDKLQQKVSELLLDKKVGDAQRLTPDYATALAGIYAEGLLAAGELKDETQAEMVSKRAALLLAQMTKAQLNAMFSSPEKQQAFLQQIMGG